MKARVVLLLLAVSLILPTSTALSDCVGTCGIDEGRDCDFLDMTAFEDEACSPYKCCATLWVCPAPGGYIICTTAGCCDIA